MKQGVALPFKLDTVLTVSQAADLKGCTRQAVRDAAKAGKIKIVVDTQESGYAMLLDRESVTAWQPSNRVKQQNEIILHSKPSHKGFIPASRRGVALPLPQASWLELRRGVWVGLLANKLRSSEIPKSVTILFSSNEVTLVRFVQNPLRVEGAK